MFNIKKRHVIVAIIRGSNNSEKEDKSLVTIAAELKTTDDVVNIRIAKGNRSF